MTGKQIPSLPTLTDPALVEKAASAFHLGTVVRVVVGDDPTAGVALLILSLDEGRGDISIAVPPDMGAQIQSAISNILPLITN